MKRLLNSIRPTLLIFGFTLLAHCLHAQCPYFTTITSSPSASHTLGIKNDGTLWAWGYNNNGQLGDGTTTDKNSPTQIGSATNWAKLSTGYDHSLGITADGKLWAWGSNTFGQLGDGTQVDKTIPTQIGTATNWVSISTGSYSSLAITTEGKLFAWGRNSSGQLGDGTQADKTTPTRVGSATNWVSVSAARYHTLGITADGKAWGWGFNGYGEVGDGTTLQKLSPTPIGTATNWASVSAGGNFFSLGITTDGKAWAWGYNSSGQLGNGTQDNKTTPAQIGSATNWVSVSAGHYHSLGITADGKAWGWGYSGSGQVGDGTTVQRTNPTQIGTTTNWVSIVSGLYHSLGITANGKLWAWGYNDSGQLGDGTNANKSAPTQIGSSPSFEGLTSISFGPISTMQQGQYNLYQNFCQLLVGISSTRASLTPITGQVTAQVWREEIQPAKYVQRHYEITPAVNPTTATGRITLYFTQADFVHYNAKNTIKLPTSSSDAAGIANLLIEKRPGTSSDGTGLPGTYTGTPVNINPADEDIVWNAAGSWWEVTFDVTGFSGFFVKTAESPLPLRLLAFSGTKETASNNLHWETADEVNTKSFELESSKDGRNFQKIATIGAISTGNNRYEYKDHTIYKGTTYYRLKMIDTDNTFSYSRIVSINRDGKNSINLFPNPVADQLNLSLDNSLINSDAKLYDIGGKLLQTIKITSGEQLINVKPLPVGMYVLKFKDGSSGAFVKE
ncbi:T9SS type A sorting domain-containing protein [Dyadobacter sp. 32]|uniref:RCC1 domain-containing protein n=1 Tax=Dyadobacter sp. 32 TaxID=538966 RepID=UPI0011EFDA52